MGVEALTEMPTMHGHFHLLNALGPADIEKWTTLLVKSMSYNCRF